MKIEWSELAQGLDVTREEFDHYYDRVTSALAESRNATINLWHEPSAGGTTLSRRLAWSLMRSHPVVILDQLSNDTAAYLRDLFHYCGGLPVLVVMEAEVVTESQREVLLQQLREDNTRAAFLWVSRVYEPQTDDVLSGRLSDPEADSFLPAYLEQVTDAGRRTALERLAKDPTLQAQRSPFFFGLTAFGEDFVGLDHLIEATLQRAQSQEAQALLGDLAIASYYSSHGFPLVEFDELCEQLTDGVRPFSDTSPLAIAAEEHIRIPHHLIAERTLKALARRPDEWKADLQLRATTLLEHIRKLSNRESDRLLRMMNTLFVTRDTVTVLEADAEIQAGGLPKQRRFSPLITDLGDVVRARSILERLCREWPRQPHYPVHYARHLLYEQPELIEKAIEVASRAESSPEGATDDTVVHTVGMCFRVRMQTTLREAKERDLRFDDVAESVRTDYEKAVELFARVTQLAPMSEYGHVASIQTASALLRSGVELSKAGTLSEFIRGEGRRWCLKALSAAEEQIALLNNQPRRQLSVRAQRVIAQWKLVYGNVDAVVAQLRVLNRQHEDVEVRRALCHAIVMKHQRHWSAIPPGDLRTIASCMERNIAERGVQDNDVRTWLRAFRHERAFDSAVAIERLVDWHQLRPDAVDPVFYIYVFYFLEWLNTQPRNPGYAGESVKWLGVCKRNRPLGSRAWGYEWLRSGGQKYTVTHFRDLPYDPVARLRRDGGTSAQALDTELARIEGTIRNYEGPQQAVLDLGQGLTVRFTPLDRVVKDDEGRRASVFISFGYDGPAGWDVRLSETTAGKGKLQG
jgi:hypothetical protein